MSDGASSADGAVDRGKTGGAEEAEKGGRDKRTLTLALAALGVVYGDIGTSPMYALREAFYGIHHIPDTALNVYGIVSLIFWSLILLITIKYVLVVMRADNKGEGGTVALLALLNPWRARAGSSSYVLLLLGLFGSAMLYAGCTITPALTVMSAVEGLSVATSALTPYVVPVTLGILVGLFVIQKHGTEQIGKLFGPVLGAWFLFIAVLGIIGITHEPRILLAVNPWYAFEFFAHNGFAGFLVLSAVFLCMTGGEAMYADMGHFGLKPVRLVWFWVVLPAVVLNYFGQGALMLARPTTTGQPFFDLASGWALYPLVGFATVAAVIASQAVISGTFSMTRQFVQLGQLPLFRVIQTSPDERGQIYMPGVNWLLMLVTLALVVGFGGSSALAGAYGISVATTMWVTTILIFFVALRRLGGVNWSLYWVVPVMLVLFIADTAFFGANLFELATGGWFPVVVAMLIFVVMTTWARGRMLLRQQLSFEAQSLEMLKKRLEQDPPYRIPGTAVFLTGEDTAPAYLMRHLDRHHVLQERVLLVTVEISDVPRVPTADRMTLIGVCRTIDRIVVRYGFMQQPNLPVALRLADRLGLGIDPGNITYYTGRETLVPDAEIPGMALWRDRLFSFLSRNARTVTSYYGLPPEDVVELGSQIRI
ncbi:MAG: potassium transporter Kup [Nevskiaceae bacterium]|nr:MAG: potassium transporter Kup [Nevskiaceae bacterium]TBR71525.1 MAG: potassium transporter Kup [Nevskiaceae bacterium]